LAANDSKFLKENDTTYDVAHFIKINVGQTGEEEESKSEILQFGSSRHSLPQNLLSHEDATKFFFFEVC